MIQRAIPRGALAVALIAAAPALCAGKCVPYDPAADPGGGAEGGAAVVCTEADEAHLLIENKSYTIRCGCRESSGLTCSVAAGTTVVWSFADSEEHNVSSVARVFGKSADKLTGTFRYTFTQPGRFSYGCTLHPAEMSGYAIVVEEKMP